LIKEECILKKLKERANRCIDQGGMYFEEVEGTCKQMY